MTHPNATNPVLIDALTVEEAYQLGIIPLTEVSLGKSFKEILTALPPDEARKARRKFRKLWRTLARRTLSGTCEAFMRGSDEAHRMGLGRATPAKVHSAVRKAAVFRELRRRARKRVTGGC